jgi:hypothetical protein
MSAPAGQWDSQCVAPEGVAHALDAAATVLVMM